MTWIQPPGYVHVMHHNTWQSNGLSVTVNTSQNRRPQCDYYSYFSDQGCRTWSLGDKKCDVGKAGISTLHKRSPGTDDFALFGKGEFCTQTADFQDGPGAAESDEICKQHCLKGDHSNGPSGYPAGVTVSAQQSNDKATTVIRLANTGAKAEAVRIKLSGSANTSATMWPPMFNDPLGANTPSDPTKILPLKTTVSLAAPLMIPPVSVAVLVVA